MSRVRQRINEFDIDLTIYPELQSAIYNLANIIFDILTNSEEDKPYLRALQHQLAITSSIIDTTLKDQFEYEESE